MAESLGQDEEREKKPLVGVAGKLTARMVARTPDPENGERLDLDRDFWRGNIIPIKPPFDKLDLLPWPERLDLLQRCKPSWEQDLKETNPKAILALGAHALRALTGSGEITKVRGCIFETEYGPVIPTYHPAYIGRGKFNLTKVWRVDLRRALYVSRHGIPRYPKHYTLYPTGMDAEHFYEGWVSAGRPPIAFDIETPHSNSKDDDPLGAGAEEMDRPIETDPSYNILEIGFSYSPYEAICFPWAEPFIGVAKRILAEAPTTYQWNGYAFDIPRLEANGALIGGDSVDLMLLWHFLEPGLPMGLKPTAAMYFFDTPAGWANKTLAKDDPKLYSCLDNDFTLRLGQMFTARARENGVWEKFLIHYVRASSVLRRMTREGVGVDRARMEKARRRFEWWKEAAIARLQPLVPLEVCPRKVYTLSEERLKESGRWEEGRMVRVVRLEKPPKPKKLPFRVYYEKVLKKGTVERSKKVMAFSEEEALGKVPGALRAELSESRGLYHETTGCSGGEVLECR